MERPTPLGVLPPEQRAAILEDLEQRAQAEGPARPVLLRVLELARQEEDPRVLPFPLRPVIDAESAAAELGEPVDVRLAREGDLDLAFRGWHLSQEEHGGEQRGGRLSVYLTAAGLLVTSSCRWGLRGRAGTVCRAGVHADPAAAVEWFRADAGGKLGPTSKELWEAACERLPALREWQTETID